MGEKRVRIRAKLASPESRSRVYCLCFGLLLNATPLFALDATPIRISLVAPPISRWGRDCAKKVTRTGGIDIGVFTAYTCNVSGVQIAPGAQASKLYGVQVGVVSSFVDYGYGVQLGGVFATAFHEYKGIQAAGIVNFTRYSLTGAQFGLINYSGPATGMQAGLLNLQVDGCSGPFLQVGGLNSTEALRGIQIGISNSHRTNSVAENTWAAQFGIHNYARDVRGFQFGVVNRAERLIGIQIGVVNIVSAKYRKIGVPFMPVVNVSW